MHKKEITNCDLRIFGLIWSVIFTVTALKFSKLFIFIALLFLVSAIFFPKIYLQIKFYQNWVKFGDVLGKINGFLISFILFYVVFAPTGIILRLLKKDLLNKKLDAKAISYFITRSVQPQNMRNQF